MKGLFFVLLACIAWGFDTLIRYPLLVKVSPSLIVFIEHFFLTIIFAPILFKNIKRIGDLTISDLFYFIILGGLGSALATLAFTRAFNYLNPSVVIVLQKFQPMFAVIMAHFFLKERLQKIFLFWATICIIGVLLIGHHDLVKIYHLLLNSKISFSSKAFLGYGLTFVAVFGWAAATVFGKLLDQKGFGVKELMGGRYIIGFLFLIPILISNVSNASNDFSLPNEIHIWLKIFLMVFISGLVGMYFYYKGLQLLSARVCTLAELFFPLCAIGLNWVFLGIGLDLLQIAGAGILVLGSTLIELKHY